MLEVIVLVLVFLCILVAVVCLVRSTYPKTVKLVMIFTFSTAMSLFMWQAYKAYVGMQNEKNAHSVEESTHTPSKKSCDSLQMAPTQIHVIELIDSTIDIHLLLNKR